MTAYQVLGLLFVHCLADFNLQTDEMATNKSRSWAALLRHTGLYASMFLAFGPRFALVTFVVHTVTDAITSRRSSRLFFFRMAPGIWTQADYTLPKHGQTLVNPWVPIPEHRHAFFVTIGWDQWLHAVQLVLTWSWLRDGAHWWLR